MELRPEGMTKLLMFFLHSALLWIQVSDEISQTKGCVTVTRGFGLPNTQLCLRLVCAHGVWGASALAVGSRLKMLPLASALLLRSNRRCGCKVVNPSKNAELPK